MILADNQPYFIPYIGYWQLMNAADVYVIADDVQYMKHAWVNRNRILTNKTNETLFNLELVKAPYTQAINERYISDVFNPEKKLNVIQCSYGKAPFFRDGMELMNQIMTCPERNLAEFLVHSIHCVRDYLGITTPMYRESELGLDPELRCEEGVYDVCKKMGADVYYNAIGGQKLYDSAEFAKRGIKLGFLKTNEIRYRQFGGSLFLVCPLLMLLCSTQKKLFLKC